jgi:drug/metabolite transporter (DMT)-like permease
VGVTLAMIVVGIGLAAVPAEHHTAEQRQRHPAAVMLAVSAALTFGGSLYATARAGATLPAAWVVLSARLVGTIALAIPLAFYGRLRLTRAAVPLVITSGICEVLGFYSFTFGSRHGIAVAAVLSSQFAALAGVAAYVLFKERLGRIQLLGVCTVIAGVAILSALRA